MAIPIIIPRLGWNMEEGIFLGWLVKEGDPVRAGESLFRLEGEKATEDIECHDSGVLRLAPSTPRDGAKVPVGTVIGYLLQEGETEIPSIVDQTEATTPVHPTALPVAAASPRRPSVKASPRARRIAAELGIDWATLQGSGQSGRVREQDVRAAPGQQRQARSPHLFAPHRRRAPDEKQAGHGSRDNDDDVRRDRPRPTPARVQS